ncbi:MAG: hypothetical protein LBT31_02680 [Synergistaceae bacterium]|jgi:hypothetical protein|nr:hypothetical protein [Synergistaceae bacterium]
MAQRELLKSVFFAAGASFLWLLSDMFNNYYLLAAAGDEPVPLSLFINLFKWLAYFFLVYANFILPFLIRYFFHRGQLYAEPAILTALVNYATVMMVMAFPLELLMGGVKVGIFNYLLSRLFKIICSVVVLIGCYNILTIPDKEEYDLIPPQDNATKCMLKLADFINYAKSNLGTKVNVERLWQTVYAYLKNDALITNAVASGVPIDSIVINAVGAVAYKLIESGRFHESRGVLTPEGQYIVSVWKMAADELVRRSFNTQQDMRRGLDVLEDAILRAG